MTHPARPTLLPLAPRHRIVLAGLLALALCGFPLRPATALAHGAAGSMDQVVDQEWRGASGKLRAAALAAAELRAWSLLPAPVGAILAAIPGVYDIGLRTAEGAPFHLLALVPFEQKRGAKVNGYRMGRWPHERPRREGRVPQGFIEVWPRDREVRVSDRFRLGDFLTKDQQEVWPKYLVLELRLLDKLELLAAELEAEGLPSELKVMSGFRTPSYNALGVGSGGRAKDSRHMYGDAADVYVDDDGDGRMDDLDGDGRVNVADARYLLALAERVEARHPDLVGGLSAYRATAVHGPFLHVDVRGQSARW
jgi:hypothetical protein